MKIIDKNYDFYDYLQGVYPDKTVTFDRTRSFTLTKDEVRAGLEYTTYDNAYLSRDGQSSYALLQVCNRFWLFEVTVINVEQGRVKDYTIDFISTWTNYNADRRLLSFGYIEIQGDDFFARWKAKTEDRKHSIAIDAINRNNYKKEFALDIEKGWYNNEYVVIKDIPLLKASGFAELINPLDIYLAIEEYFSLERTAAERRESIGLTNDDKITNHGFDTKISFRGGQKKKKRKKG